MQRIFHYQKRFFIVWNIIFSDNQDFTAAGVLLANTYGLSGNKSMASNIRMKLSQSDVKKIFGCCWTVYGGKVHVS